MYNILFKYKNICIKLLLQNVFVEHFLKYLYDNYDLFVHIINHSDISGPEILKRFLHYLDIYTGSFIVEFVLDHDSNVAREWFLNNLTCNYEKAKRFFSLVNNSTIHKIFKDNCR